MQPALITESSNSKAFSLLEVVISVAIFAGAIVIILALFGPLNRSIGEVSDQGKASRLADAIGLELMRIRDVQVGSAEVKFAAFASFFEGEKVVRLVASTEGDRVIRESDAANDALTGSPRGVLLRDRYYLIEVRNQPVPLNYRAESGFIALTATIKWPYYVANGEAATDATVADLSEAQSFALNYAITP